MARKYPDKTLKATSYNLWNCVTDSVAQLLQIRYFGGLRYNKSKVIGTVANPIILYVAPTWQKPIRIIRNVDKMKRLESKKNLRICIAYRTVLSAKAVQVLVGSQ